AISWIFGFETRIFRTIFPPPPPFYPPWTISDESKDPIHHMVVPGLHWGGCPRDGPGVCRSAYAGFRALSGKCGSGNSPEDHSAIPALFRGFLSGFPHTSSSSLGRSPGLCEQYHGRGHTELRDGQFRRIECSGPALS